MCVLCICEMDMFLKLQAVPFATHHRYEMEGDKVISGGVDLWTSSIPLPKSVFSNF